MICIYYIKLIFFGIHAIFHGFWPHTNTNRVILSKAMHFQVYLENFQKNPGS